MTLRLQHGEGVLRQGAWGPSRVRARDRGGRCATHWMHAGGWAQQLNVPRPGRGRAHQGDLAARLLTHAPRRRARTCCCRWHWARPPAWLAAGSGQAVLRTVWQKAVTDAGQLSQSAVQESAVKRAARAKSQCRRAALAPRAERTAAKQLRAGAAAAGASGAIISERPGWLIGGRVGGHGARGGGLCGGRCGCVATERPGFSCKPWLANPSDRAQTRGLGGKSKCAAGE